MGRGTTQSAGDPEYASRQAGRGHGRGRRRGEEEIRGAQEGRELVLRLVHGEGGGRGGRVHIPRRRLPLRGPRLRQDLLHGPLLRLPARHGRQRETPRALPFLHASHAPDPPQARESRAHRGHRGDIRAARRGEDQGFVPGRVPGHGRRGRHDHPPSDGPAVGKGRHRRDHVQPGTRRAVQKRAQSRAVHSVHRSHQGQVRGAPDGERQGLQAHRAGHRRGGQRGWIERRGGIQGDVAGSFGGRVARGG